MPTGLRVKGGWPQKLDSNKRAYAAEFVTRARFVSDYPTTMPPAEFVDKLFTNALVTPSDSHRSATINEFGTATTSRMPRWSRRSWRQLNIAGAFRGDLQCAGASVAPLATLFRTFSGNPPATAGGTDLASRLADPGVLHYASAMAGLCAGGFLVFFLRIAAETKVIINPTGNGSVKVRAALMKGLSRYFN